MPHAVKFAIVQLRGGFRGGQFVTASNSLYPLISPSFAEK